jgi:hypothetical protein
MTSEIVRTCPLRSVNNTPTQYLHFAFEVPRPRDGGQYVCRYEIRVDRDLMHAAEAHGRDAVEALRRAMGFAVIDLEWGFHNLTKLVHDSDLHDLRLAGAESVVRQVI